MLLKSGCLSGRFWFAVAALLVASSSYARPSSSIEGDDAVEATRVPATDPFQYWHKVDSSALPSLQPEGELADLSLAIERQIEACKEFAQGHFSVCKDESDLVKLNCDDPTLQHMLKLVKSSTDWKVFYGRIKQDFDWFHYVGADQTGNVEVTAYNAPAYEASLTKSEKFIYPLYSRPSDLVDLTQPDGKIIWRKKLPDGNLVSYDDREAIDLHNSLAGKSKQVAYMADLLDVMRLQGEGSGVLMIHQDDGSVAQYGANYAGQNGRPQISISGYLKAKGVDSKYFSFSGQKKYFALHPEDLWPAVITNPSYVFFSATTEPPCGTGKVYLTPGHSMAVDPRHIPLGTLVLVKSVRPLQPSAEKTADQEFEPSARASQKFTRLMIAQDTGGPIIGAHIDTYWGSSNYAQFLSDDMTENGALYLPRLKDRDLLR